MVSTLDPFTIALPVVVGPLILEGPDSCADCEGSIGTWELATASCKALPSGLLEVGLAGQRAVILFSNSGILIDLLSMVPDSLSTGDILYKGKSLIQFE